MLCLRRNDHRHARLVNRGHILWSRILALRVLVDNFIQTSFNKTRSYINIAYFSAWFSFYVIRYLLILVHQQTCLWETDSPGDPLQNQTFIRYMQYVIAISKLAVSSK